MPWAGRWRSCARRSPSSPSSPPSPAAPAAQASNPPTSTGYGGAAATVDRLATKAAVDTLRRGGNATDAAVTAAAVLGVTEPFSCGIGGGGFMVAYDADKKRVTTLDHRERAPQAMHPESFFENGAPLAFNDARYSGLSVGVPGTVLGWERALKRHGTITLAQALAPAVKVARAGLRRRRHVRGADPGEPRLLRRRARPRRPCTSIPTARRATSARCFATPTSRARTG